MSRKGSIISSNAKEDYIVVNSRAYGKHRRAKRGSHKPLVVTDAMKKAGELTRAANTYAKVINDAFKPFCEDMRDGKRWSRLVALFKTQLHQSGAVQLSGLDKEFYFHRRHSLGTVLKHRVEISEDTANRFLIIKVNFISSAKLKTDADGVELTLIAIFLDADFHATVATDQSHYKILPATHQEHTASIPVPPGAVKVIVAMKCKHMYRDKKLTPGMGMGVVNVMDLKATES